MLWTHKNRIRNCNIRERNALLFCCKRQVTFSETKMTRKSGLHGRTNTRNNPQLRSRSYWMLCDVVVDRCNCFEGICRFRFQVFSSANTETADSSYTALNPSRLQLTASSHCRVDVIIPDLNWLPPEGRYRAKCHKCRSKIKTGYQNVGVGLREGERGRE